MLNQSNAKPKRSGPQILSTVLFLAAIAFAAAAVYLWYVDDSDSNGEAPVPTVSAGIYNLVNVLGAFQDADIEVDYGRTPATASSDQLSQPGQNLKVEDASVFIFIYPGGDAESAAAAREDAFAAIDPETMTLTTPSGNDVSNGEPLSVYQGANVIAVLVGGDEELQTQVQDVIEGLS